MTMRTVLEPAEVEALEATLDDEYKSYETYAQVLRDFGDVRPFSNIVKAESRHFTALLALFETYGLAPPPNRWAGHAPRFNSLHAACFAAVQGEIDNVHLYDRALMTTRRPDILATWQALRSASLDRHLPAFRRCAEGGGRGR
ncbi:MAG: ferritin-like domain-containing protein [Paracoccaceae bacterium]